MSDLMQQVRAALPVPLPDHLGVAVSGGGDSVALLVLLHRLSAEDGFDLSCVTVDHGLRPEAASEAQEVARLCAALAVPHRTLHWRGWDKTGNTQNAARMARYALMADWAQTQAISTILLGHTLDDQAETVVMRLARGAGVDGLSAMAGTRTAHGIVWSRPLLGISRAALRAFLRAEGIAWSEDPSNDDTKFERIKVRQILEVLAPLGIEPAGLAQVAQHMASAREALDMQTCATAKSIVSLAGGGLRITYDRFEALPPEIARRLILGALQWISGAPYAPRGRSLAIALQAVRDSGSATLDGCHLQRKNDALWVFREYKAVRDLSSRPDALWDGRWVISGPARTGQTVRALGETGLAECPKWREMGLPRALLRATPAIWDDRGLCAAPVAGNAGLWRAQVENGDSSFFQTLIAH